MKNEKQYTKVKLNHDSVETRVKFADLNKNNTLEDYKAEVEKGDFSYQDVLVRQVVYVSQGVFDYLAGEFLEDNDVWDKVGGSNLTKEDLVAFDAKFEHASTKDFWEWGAEAQTWFRKHSKTEVSKVVNVDSGEVFYANTEGYKYARYVGLPA